MIKIDLNHYPYLFCLYSFPIGLVHNLAQNFPGAELRPWSPTGVLQLPWPSQNQLNLFVVLQLGLNLQKTKFCEIWTYFTSSTRPRPFYIEFTIENRYISDFLILQKNGKNNGNFLLSPMCSTHLKMGV